MTAPAFVPSIAPMLWHCTPPTGCGKSSFMVKVSDQYWAPPAACPHCGKANRPFTPFVGTFVSVSDLAVVGAFDPTSPVYSFSASGVFVDAKELQDLRDKAAKYDAACTGDSRPIDERRREAKALARKHFTGASLAAADQLIDVIADAMTGTPEPR